MKRLFDFCLGLAGLVVLLPAICAIAIIVFAGDGGPPFFLQARVGIKGKTFMIWKFRTMRLRAESQGPAITSRGDHRVTRVGRVLRAWKLDELPQLINVVAGSMSFVGPRPEVPKYVKMYSPEERQVLRLKPGITDVASLRFRDEEALLAQAENPEEYYRQYCIPTKIALNLKYAERATVWSDICIIASTISVLTSRTK